MYDITILQIYNYFFKSSYYKYIIISLSHLLSLIKLGYTQGYVLPKMGYTLTSKAIFEFRVSYKEGSKMDPLLDPLKKGVTKWNPLNES